MVQEFIVSLEELDDVVQFLSKLILEKKKPFAILFSGELGSGKTTLIRKLVLSFIQESSPNSPTYNLMQEYKNNEYHFFHFDLYRVKEKEELAFLGFDEIWEKNGISLVEWWEIASDYFSEDSILIQIEVLEEKRRIFIGRKNDFKH
ncbi:MAG: tRNA (adenosine(37)-N6)-threonylcarbamoyltransferase complex ATPase subunit type 1 TsaE [Leptospiraceae bacterium]|nr:tRNA (adenosine(37)-N6)-threonylcarbamoyltransferase complex ATPase subunit type 1 TsaE [Leptospiraceae bacterium]